MKLSSLNVKIFLSLLFLFFSSATFAALTPQETQIRDDVLHQDKDQLKWLEKLVNINSGTSNIKGVRQVGELLKPEFEKMGFKTRWVEEPPSMKRAPTLIAERKGTQGKRLLLIAHLDTVFPKNSSYQKFQLNKNSAKGPGVLDDKGGLVVILFALKALQTAHALDNTNITVVMTGDEEDSGKPTSISRKPLIDVAKKSDIALDFESAITLNTATIARRGISNWTIETSGNESHSATIFQKDVGAGAIFEMARILQAMRTNYAKEKYLSFNPGLILGGTKINYDNATSLGDAFGKQNVVAKKGMIKGDFRFLSLQQKETFEKNMTALVKQSLPGTKSSIAFEDGIPAMQPTKNNLALLKQYSQASQDLNLGTIVPLDAGLRGAGDISHVAAIVPANLAGLGPLGWGAHSVIESVELSSLPIQTERAAILIYRLSR